MQQLLDLGYDDAFVTRIGALPFDTTPHSEFPCTSDLRRDNAHQVRQHEDSDSGYIKIIFYFYQVAGLQIDTGMKSQLKKLNFFAFVISSINFQVTTVNNIGCPFPGLKAVTKELLLSGTVLLTMANVFTVFFVHLFINTLRQKDKP